MTSGKKTILLFSSLLILACNSGNENQQYTAIIEGTIVKVPALAAGQIKAMFTELGDVVDSNQVVAIVDSTELVLQKQQLIASLKEIRVQAEIARANMQRNIQDKAYIQTKVERIKNLYEAKSVPQQDFDDINNQLENVTTALTTSRQQLQSLSARMEQVQSQIDLLNKKIKDTVIKSPTEGIITAKYFEYGEAIPLMQPIVEVTDIHQVDTKIYISEQLLATIKYGQIVTVRIDGLEQVLTGKVTWISPKAEFTPKNILTPETRTSLVYAVKITIENPQLILKHGMPVVIEI